MFVEYLALISVLIRFSAFMDTDARRRRNALGTSKGNANSPLVSLATLESLKLSSDITACYSDGMHTITVG